MVGRSTWVSVGCSKGLQIHLFFNKQPEFSAEAQIMLKVSRFQAQDMLVICLFLVRQKWLSRLQFVFGAFPSRKLHSAVGLTGFCLFGSNAIKMTLAKFGFKNHFSASLICLAYAYFFKNFQAHMLINFMLNKKKVYLFFIYNTI